MAFRGKKGSKSSNPFDRMMQEQCNKPVAAKSAGIVGKWGATSFTSVRATSEKPATAHRPNKFFKSRAENSENTTEVESAPVKEKEETKPTKPVRKDKDVRIKQSVKGDKKERTAWSASTVVRPPLERSPLHPSRSPLHPSPSSNPSTTPPRSRNQSKKVEDVLSKENKESVPSQPKSAKDQMFDSLVSASRTNDKKEDRRKRKQDEDGGGPRIKLKISVNRSPDKSDSTYKVVRKDDDLLSVCSQSSEATSEAGSDKTDVSNGFAHKRSNPYSQDQSTSSAFKKATAPSTVAQSSKAKAVASMDQPAAARVSRAINYNTSLPENKTTNSHPQDKANPPTQQLTKVKSADHNNFGAKPAAKSADPDLGGKPTRSRGGGGADKAVLLENEPIITKPLRESKVGVSASSGSDEVSGSKPPFGGARSRSPAVIQPKSTASDVATKESKPVAGLGKRRGRPAAAAGGNNLVVASAHIETNASSDKPNKEDKSENSKIKSSSEEISVPPPTKRRLRGGLAAKPPSLETAKPVPEPVKTNIAVEEPQKAPETIEAPAVPPKRKFFKSKAAPVVAPKSSSVASAAIKTEPKKIESSNFSLKKENLEADFDLNEGLVKPEPFSSKPTKSTSSESKLLSKTENPPNRKEVKLENAPTVNSVKLESAPTTSIKLGSAQPPKAKLVSAPPRSPSPEFSLELPDLNVDQAPPVPEPKQAQTYNKKRFFKSRNKTATNAPESQPPPKLASDFTEKEPPRVPPVSEHFVQIAAVGDSKSSSAADKSASNQVSKILASVKSPPRPTRFTRNREATTTTTSSTTNTAGVTTKAGSASGPNGNQTTTASSKPSVEASKVVPDKTKEEDFTSSQETMPPPEDDFKDPSMEERVSKVVKPGEKPAKKTFFKSKKAPGAGLQSKAMSLYRHNVGWSGGNFKGEDKKLGGGGDMYDMGDFSDGEEGEGGAPTNLGDISLAPSKITRVATYPMADTNTDLDGDLVTQVKCPKSYKPLFTVIKNVKRAHELNDHGEDQEFQDDVEYIVEGLNAKHRIPLRCLTAISLASKCMTPNFRMHLRAHSVVDKFFSELQDAPDNASLALCTATVMFVLSQDRLNMDLDRDSLKLMLNLLDTDSKLSSALEDDSGLDKKELEKNKQKVIDICAEMKRMGHATSLNLELISADHLSMETLLSMTSQRSGEWFKEELRELGGIGHLARTVSDCINYLTIKPIDSWTEMLKDKLKKATRILRVLENVSHENEENCNYLLEYKIDNQEFISNLQKLFSLLDSEVQLNPSTDLSDKDSIAVVIREALFSLMRVHINLAYDYNFNALGSLIIGRQEGMIQRSLRCLFIIPFWFVPLSKRFECLILALTLLVNLVETCLENRSLLMDSMAAQKELGLCVKEEPRLAIEDLVQMYLDREELARISEQKTDNILDDVEEEVQEIDPTDADKDKKDTLEETVQKLINKAGSHMESCIIAAYIGLVLGYLVKENDDYECRIREYLPSKDFKSMVVVLEKLSKFMAMTSGGSSYVNKSIKGTQKMIKYLEKLDAEPESENEGDGFELDSSNLDMSFDVEDSINLPDMPRNDYSRTQYGTTAIDDMDDF